MMTDALLQLSDAQAVTSSAVSTNTIDLSEARDVGAGKALYAVVTVDEAVTSDSAATVTFQVLTSSKADLSSATVLGQSGPIAKGDLTAGRTPIVVPIPQENLPSEATGQRYLGVKYDASATLTAGKFSCYIADSAVSGPAYYDSGFSVY